jgi:predicted LPLAT superfamily acyltransferase
VLQAPVVLFFGLYRGGRCYDIHFELLADRVTLDRATRQADIRRWVQLYASRLEYHCRAYPYNWFNFYDFWAELGDLPSPALRLVRAVGRAAGRIVRRPGAGVRRRRVGG